MKLILTIICAVYFLTACSINPHNAVARNDLTYLKNLPASEVNKGPWASSDFTPLHVAASNNRLEAMDILIAKGANPNAYSYTMGLAPIHGAVFNGHYEAVKKLIDLNVDLNVKNQAGATPLEISIIQGNNAIFDLLMDSAVDINFKGAHGHTPLIASIIRQKPEFTQKLIKAGADVNTTGKNGATALGESAATGQSSIVSLLITSGANLNAQSHFGDTALHWAVAKRHITSAKLLIEAGADLTIRSSSGKTARDIAMGFPALISLFPKLTSTVQPPPPKAPSKPNTPPPIENALIGTGSAFSINKDGGFITNHHVIKKCGTVSIFKNSKEYNATVVHYDYKNDLAYIVSDELANDKFVSISPAQQHLGEQLVVLGFPLTSLMGNTIKLTDGSLSSLTGLGGDSSLYQISAPIQAGNSGGPVFNEQGNVIGVASSTLNAAYMLKHRDDIPQNVNFAVKSSILLSFLSANNIAHNLSSNSNSPAKSTKNIYKDNVDSLAMVLCLQ